MNKINYWIAAAVVFFIGSAVSDISAVPNGYQTSWAYIVGVVSFAVVTLIDEYNDH